MVQRLVDGLKQRPGLIVLIDGLGATLSAVFLGVVLPALERYVGMPRRVLFILALVALMYGAYSIAGYSLRRDRWRTWLRIISHLNLAYSGVTAALVVAFWERLTFAGVTYFLLEILIICALVVVERRILRMTRRLSASGAGTRRRVRRAQLPSRTTAPTGRRRGR